VLAVLDVRHVYDLSKQIFINYLSIQPLAADAKHVSPASVAEQTAALSSPLAVLR
jgi:hypothetical protein